MRWECSIFVFSYLRCLFLSSKFTHNVGCDCVGRYQTVSKQWRQIILNKTVHVVLWKGKYRTQYHHIHQLVKLTKHIQLMDLSRTEVWLFCLVLVNDVACMILKNVFLFRLQVSNEAFGALAQLTNLVSLNIAKTFIVWGSTEHPITQLTSLTHLRFTNENGWKRVSTYVQNPKTSDFFHLSFSLSVLIFNFSWHCEIFQLVTLLLLRHCVRFPFMERLHLKICFSSLFWNDSNSNFVKGSILTSSRN